MSDQHIIFSPERNQWTLTDGRHHMEVPEWAREIMRDEFERETRPLRDSLDLALDSKRIAERRVTELLVENSQLRERITTQKQTIQAYRDESREWREVAERVQAENAKLRSARDVWQENDAKLRELVRDMNKWLWNGADCTECPFTAECDLNAAFESDLHAHICIGWNEIHDRMRELGVEV